MLPTDVLPASDLRFCLLELELEGAPQGVPEATHVAKQSCHLYVGVMTKWKRPAEPAPTASDPDFDVIGGGDEDQADVALMFGQGLAAFVPESLRRAADRNPELLHALEAIQANVEHRRHLLEQLDYAVAAARHAGASWVHIGWCLGITSEAARRRFS